MDWLILANGLLRSMFWLLTAYYLWRARQTVGAGAGCIAALNSMIFAIDNSGGHVPHSLFVAVNYLSTPVAAAFAMVASTRPDLRRDAGDGVQ